MCVTSGTLQQRQYLLSCLLMLEGVRDTECNRQTLLCRRTSMTLDSTENRYAHAASIDSRPVILPVQPDICPTDFRISQLRFAKSPLRFGILFSPLRDLRDEGRGGEGRKGA